MSSLDSIWKDRRLSTLIKIRTYFPLVQSVLLYASETWTLTSAESRSLEAFHMKCQRRLLRISCQQFVRNEEVRAQTGLSSVLDITSRRRISIFGHITRLQASVPARKAVAVHVSSSFCRPPDSSWRRRPGRPRGRWLDQIRRNTGQIPADHWKQTQRRGHRRGGGTMATWWMNVPIAGGSPFPRCRAYKRRRCLTVVFTRRP